MFFLAWIPISTYLRSLTSLQANFNTIPRRIDNIAYYSLVSLSSLRILCHIEIKWQFYEAPPILAAHVVSKTIFPRALWPVITIITWSNHLLNFEPQLPSALCSSSIPHLEFYNLMRLLRTRGYFTTLNYNWV